MIIKKKLLSNEIIKKKKNIINYKDTELFNNDFTNKTGKSYSYFMKDANILNDGKISTFNYDIISDYLSFNSLSKFVFFKKTASNLFKLLNFSRNGPEGISLPFPIQFIVSKHTNFKL